MPTTLTARGRRYINPMAHVRQAMRLIEAANKMRRGYKSYRARQRKRVFKKRAKRTGVRKETRRRTKNPYHSSLQRMYNHNDMKFCVNHQSKMYNVSPDTIEHLGSSDELYQIQQYADSYVITNNGTEVSQLTTPFTGNEITYYTNYAPLYPFQNLGGWFDEGSTAIAENKLTNELYKLRTFYKKWKIDKVSIRIKWKNTSSQGLPLQIPDGYYALIEPKKIREYYKDDGTLSTDVTNRVMSEMISINAEEVLRRVYGVPPTQAAHGTAGESPGAFPRTSTSSDQQTEFTFDEINESSRDGLIKWKKIPKQQLLNIQYNYNSAFSRTTSINGVPNNPILIFVFRDNKMWLPPSTYTEHNDGTNMSDATSYTSHVESGKQPLPAVIADCETLFCYSFKDRSESVDTVDTIPTSSRSLIGDNLPYFTT